MSVSSGSSSSVDFDVNGDAIFHNPDAIELMAHTKASDAKGSYAPVALSHDAIVQDALTVLEQQAPLNRTEMGQITVNIIISFVGAGLLAIPQAISKAGWLLGAFTLGTVSALNVYAMLLLPKVRTRLQYTCNNNCSTYGQLGRALLGTRGELLVNLCLLVSQTGFATAYLIFIAESLSQYHRWKVVFGCVPGLCFLVQARDMKLLSPFSLLANCANAVGLSAVLLQDWETLEEETSEPSATEPSAVHAIRFGGILSVMAVTLYSMEGVGLILSLEASCRNRPQFPGLLARVVGAITVFMAVFGVAGYAAFGDQTQAPITNNLGNSRAASMVQGALCVALYLTYPIMMFPVWNIAEQRLLGLHNGSSNNGDATAARILLRMATVLVTAIVAYAVPSFGDYLDLVGSSLCTVLGFLLPCYFHLQVFGSELGLGEWLLNVCLIGGGALFAVVGTIQSALHMMQQQQENDG